MISSEVIAILLSGISISASLFYYANVLQNANKTRQAQLFMTLYDRRSQPVFQKQYTRITNRTWINNEDWEEKYGPFTNPDASAEMQSIMFFFDGVGMLLKRNLIDIGMINDLLYGSTKRIWEQFEPIVKYIRTEATWDPHVWNHFEYLYHELIEYNKKHPEPPI